MELFSAFNCSIILHTSESRFAILWEGLGGRMQNEEASLFNCSSRVFLCSSFSCSSLPFSWIAFSFSWRFLSFSRTSLSFFWTSFSFSWTSCLRSSTFFKTCPSSSVGKHVWVFTSWISTVERPRAKNAFSTLLMAFWNSTSERWPRAICANSSFRNSLSLFTFDLTTVLRLWMQSEKRMA